MIREFTRVPPDNKRHPRSNSATCIEVSAKTQAADPLRVGSLKQTVPSRWSDGRLSRQGQVLISIRILFSQLLAKIASASDRSGETPPELGMDTIWPSLAA